MPLEVQPGFVQHSNAGLLFSVSAMECIQAGLFDVDVIGAYLAVRSDSPFLLSFRVTKRMQSTCTQDTTIQTEDEVLM